MGNVDLKFLEDLYNRYNKREFVHPDPLEFLYTYNDVRDREIVALIASSLAYGRVAQILKSVSLVLGKMTPSPYEFILNSEEKSMNAVFLGYKHRFTEGFDLIRLLVGIKAVLKSHETLNRCFLAGFDSHDKNLVPAIANFVDKLSGDKGVSLLPHPERGSACKRLNLFLRWMIRCDEVDLGGWNGVDKSKLIIPLDTHMHKISLMFGLTKRKQADMKTALEITSGFAKLNPADPVKYDFTLTRFGIRSEMNISTIQSV